MENVIGKTEIWNGQQFKRQKNNPTEFKRSEISDYSTSPSCPDTLKTSATEWEVLYTTQLTQKAKKFHDGILKLASCGLQRRQVFLYDTNRRLLDSRFLKSNEMIRSGESLKLDGHLVDIGECEGDHKPVKDLNLQGRNSIVVEETGILHEQVQAHTNYPVEWDAMYTTQITQKSKKYHSGFLRLASCGSFRMQVTLLTEDGTTLSRRYLKSSEHMNSGSTCQFSNYLVEVGGPRKYADGNLRNNDSVWKDEDSCIGSSNVDSIKLSRRVSANKLLSNAKLHNNASPRKESDSTVRSSQAENIKTNMEVSTSKPLRNARAILSILKRPTTQEGIVSLKRESMESRAFQTSDFVHFDIQNGVEGQPKENSHSQSSVVEEDKNPEVTIIHNCNNDNLNINPYNDRRDPQPKILASSISSRRKSNSAAMNPQVINAQSDCIPPTASVLNDGSTGNGEIENVPELVSSKASSFSLSQPSKVAQPGKSSQPPCADDMGISPKFNKASRFSTLASSDRISRDPCDVEMKSPSMCMPDEFPSFDLGF